MPMLSVLALKVLIKNENKSFVAERARQIHFPSAHSGWSASAMIESRNNFNLCFRLVIDSMDKASWLLACRKHFHAEVFIHYANWMRRWGVLIDFLLLLLQRRSRKCKSHNTSGRRERLEWAHQASKMLLTPCLLAITSHRLGVSFENIRINSSNCYRAWVCARCGTLKWISSGVTINKVWQVFFAFQLLRLLQQHQRLEAEIARHERMKKRLKRLQLSNEGRRLALECLSKFPFSHSGSRVFHEIATTEINGICLAI